jgi:hypothetical protein
MAQVYHFQINVCDAARSLPFYKALLGYLEYRTVYESDTVAGFWGIGADIRVIAPTPASASIASGRASVTWPSGWSAGKRWIASATSS